MDPGQAYEQQDTVQLLDVRETDEWVAGHIDGALHIPMGDLKSRQRELAMDRPVVTVCRSGTRAAAAPMPSNLPATAPRRSRAA